MYMLIYWTLVHIEIIFGALFISRTDTGVQMACSWR